MKEFLLIPAGGSGTRIADLTENKMHKCCLRIDSKSLLHRVIEFWNIEDIFLLLRDNYESVINESKLLQIYTKKNINPVIELKQIGKGGAILNAIKYLNFEDNDIFIVHNSDDILLNEDKDRIIFEHLNSNKDISIIGVMETQSPYTGFTVIGNNVISVEPKFKIKKAVHTGITILSGKYLKSKIQENKIECFDFEEVWFSEESSKNNINFIEVNFNNWFPVNDNKMFAKLRKEISIND